MRTVIVVDSEYGNTYELAQAVADEFRVAGAVDVINVRATHHELRQATDIDMLIVGGPTQMHGVSQPLTDYLNGLPPRFLSGVAAASFDTRLRGWPLFTGAASGGIARHLKRLGAHMIVSPESFLVMAKEGPLVEGELERARTWAKQFVGAASTRGAALTAR
jgi:flavodoxin